MNQPQIDFELYEMPQQVCPSCFKPGMTSFYSIDQIPVHSCLLVPSEEEALTFPRGDLRLAICHHCGFISNLDFDASVHNYSNRYEESQGFSACFNAFQDRLIERLVQQYNLRGKDVLEIGCGKGEFLTRLCEVGGNRGIGIDPGYVPGRSAHEEDITFIRDFYSEAYADLQADFIVCRHTLEHIAPTGNFLRTVRQSIGDRKDVLVFFEVPDAVRVLKEGAFWDIYYEHCSYFSCGSLARLFRNTGFDLLELSLDFDDQYILLVARPSVGPTTPRLTVEDDMEPLARAVEDFSFRCRERVERWRQFVAALGGRRAVAWGSGSKGVAFLTTLKLTSEVPYVVDINKYRQGKFMPATAQRIVPPDFLSQYRPEEVIVMNPVYCSEIQADLDRLGVKARLLTV